MGTTIVLPNMDPNDSECTDTIHDAIKYWKEFQFLEKGELDRGNEIIEALNEIFFMHGKGMDAKDTLIQSSFTQSTINNGSRKVGHSTKLGHELDGMSVCPSIGKALLPNPILQIASCKGVSMDMIRELKNHTPLSIAETASSIYNTTYGELMSRRPTLHMPRLRILSPTRATNRKMKLYNLTFSRKEPTSSMFYSRFQSSVIHSIKEKYAESAIHRNDHEAAALYILSRAKGTTDTIFSKGILDKISSTIKAETPDISKYLHRAIHTLESTSVRVATHIASHDTHLTNIANLSVNYPFIGRINHMGIDMSLVYSPVQIPTLLTTIESTPYATPSTALFSIYTSVVDATKNKGGWNWERTVEMTSRSAKLWPHSEMLASNDSKGTYPYPISGGTLIGRQTHEKHTQPRGANASSYLKGIASNSVSVPPAFDPSKETEKFDSLVRDMQTIYTHIGVTDTRTHRSGSEEKMPPYFAAIYMSVCTSTNFRRLIDPALICYDLTLVEIYAMIELYSMVCAVDRSFYVPVSVLAKDIHQQIITLIRTHNIAVNNVVQACKKFNIVTNCENLEMHSSLSASKARKITMSAKSCDAAIENIDNCYMSKGTKRAAKRSVGGIIVIRPDAESLGTLKSINGNNVVVIAREPRGIGIDSMKYVKEAIEGEK